jgi:FMN phosphatase YigB (HAD superfamily)
MSNIKVVSLDLFETLVHFKSELFDSRIALEKAIENHPNAPSLSFDLVYSQYREIVRSKIQNYDEELEFRNEDVLVKIWEVNRIKINSQIEEIALNIMIDYFNNVTPLIDPIIGVFDTLEAFRASGQQLILLSNHSFARNGVEIMNKLNLAQFFARMIFSAERGFKKPSSKIFDLIKKTFPDNSEEEIVHIGDDIRADVYGALKYGIKAVWIKNSKYLDLETAISDHPNYLGAINSIKDAPTLLTR